MPESAPEQTPNQHEYDPGQQGERRKPQLTEQEIDKLAEKVWKRMEQRLYQNAGRGVVQLLTRFGLIGLAALAAFGANYGHKHGWF